MGDSDEKLLEEFHPDPGVYKMKEDRGDEMENVEIEIPGIEIDTAGKIVQTSREELGMQDAEEKPKKRRGRPPKAVAHEVATEPKVIAETPAVKVLEEKRKATVNDEPKIPMPKNASAPSASILNDLKEKTAKKRKEEAAIAAKIAADPDVPNARITALEARMSAIEARLNAGS